MGSYSAAQTSPNSRGNTAAPFLRQVPTPLPDPCSLGSLPEVIFGILFDRLFRSVARDPRGCLSARACLGAEGSQAPLSLLPFFLRSRALKPSQSQWFSQVLFHPAFLAVLGRRVGLILGSYYTSTEWLASVKGTNMLSTCLNNLHNTTHSNSIIILKSKFSYFLSFMGEENGNLRGKWFVQDYTVYIYYVKNLKQQTEFKVILLLWGSLPIWDPWGEASASH